MARTWKNLRVTLSKIPVTKSKQKVAMTCELSSAVKPCARHLPDEDDENVHSRLCKTITEIHEWFALGLHTAKDDTHEDREHHKAQDVGGTSGWTTRLPYCRRHIWRYRYMKVYYVFLKDLWGENSEAKRRLKLDDYLWCKNMFPPTTYSANVRTVYKHEILLCTF